MTRPAPGATGCCGPSPPAPTNCRSCTGSAARVGWPGGQSPWLPGCEGSRPVRIGNAAVKQTQLDVYGEVLDALYHAHCHGLPTVDRAVAIGRTLLGHLARIWRQPDEGIWEVRGPPQHFTHSKVTAWVAFDRAVKFREQLGGQVG